MNNKMYGVFFTVLALSILAACVGKSPTTVPAETSSPLRASGTVVSPIEQSLAELQGLSIEDFFERSFRILSLRDPDGLITAGLAQELGVDKAQFTPQSDGYVHETQRLEDGVLELLHGYDRMSLTQDQQISYDIYEWYLRSLVEGHPYMYHNYLVSGFPLRSVDMSMQDFLINYFPIANETDARAYVSRLESFDVWMDQVLEGLRLREESGFLPARYMLEALLYSIEQDTLILDGKGNPTPQSMGIYTSFRQRVSSISSIPSETRSELQDAALDAVKEKVVPAYLALRDLVLEWMEKTDDSPDLTEWVQGEEYYSYMLWKETSTDLSAAEIHQLGLRETERIQGEMRVLAHEQLGLADDIAMGDLTAYLQENSGYYSGSSALQNYQDLYEEMKSIVPAYFDLFPSAELSIVSGPLAYLNYYSYPALDGSRPGIYFSANQGSPAYLASTTFYHEGIPGHHVTGALSLELDLPTFQRVIGINAYLEGWALYAEHLAVEMGMYEEDVYGNLGRLNMELMRAVRLVVDTGLNSMGWTWQEAIDFWNGAMGTQYDMSEMVRYAAIPGQGCSYLVGYLKFMELRARAQEALGDGFDLKQFHNLVLQYGPMPLEVLEQVVDDWIESNGE